MNMNLRKTQGGFTLIELVIVIVLLGLLAAVALPRFLDLTEEAEAATCQGIKGALSSSAAILIASGDGKEVGATASRANILGATIQDGWSGSVATAACDFDIDLESGGECTVSIDDSLASDCP